MGTSKKQDGTRINPMNKTIPITYTPKVGRDFLLRRAAYHELQAETCKDCPTYKAEPDWHLYMAERYRVAAND